MLISRLRNRAEIKVDFWRNYLSDRFPPARSSPRDPDAFAEVEACCLFIGHPRSGSTLIGSLLDAHPEIAIATELDALRFVELGTNRRHLYDAMLKKADDFVHRLDYRWEGYRFEVPNQFQGRTTTLRVIGDKKAGVTARRLRDQPDLLARLEDLVGDPVKIIQVVRNPFDNITTRWRRGRFEMLKKPLTPVIAEYFSFYESAMRAQAAIGEQHFLTVHHEDVIADPSKEIAVMCRFLGVEAGPDYLKDCAGLVKPSAHQARFGISWTDEDIAEVERHMEGFPALARYSFAGEDTRPPSKAAGPAAS